MPEKIKIFYLANARIPTEKAHGIQIMKMCEALAEQSCELELVIPRRINRLKIDGFEYYKVKKDFSFVRIVCLDLLMLPFFKTAAYWLQILSFSFFTAIYFFRKQDVNLVYTRDLICVLFLSKRFQVVYEAHNIPNKRGWLYRRLINKVDKVVAITHGLKDDFLKLGVDAQKIFVAPDAVDLKQFVVSNSRDECRRRVGLPLEKKIALYSGHLYQWKGVYTVLESAKLLPEVLFVFVGGLRDELQSFLKKAKALGLKNIITTGQKKHGEVPYFLKAADVLLLSNSARERISVHYTSPLKMFEYMASGSPIVAVDLPSIREILNDQNAVLVEADSDSDMARGIRNLLDNEKIGQALAGRALLDVEKHTWQNRAKNILEFINL